MAKQETCKTPRGERLVAIRKLLGYEQRQDFADLLGMPKASLGNYERGDRDMSPELYALYHDMFGADLNWLVAGTGHPFVDIRKAVAIAAPGAPLLDHARRTTQPG